MNFKTDSYGKILITSEYAVLKGALALAVPTKFKQSLSFTKKNFEFLVWKSYDSNNKIWFECEIELFNIEILKSSNEKIGKSLISVLKAAKKLNPKFLNKNFKGLVETRLDFPNNWGLGTSSTLINNIAKWANISPYKLLWSNFNGSGYDIACADSISPILYQLKNKNPIIEVASFSPNFHKNLFFIHLNKKQDTNKEIKNFNEKKIDTKLVKYFSKLTNDFLSATNLTDFKSYMLDHENILSKELNILTVKDKLFKDFEGEIKSLGAWGGDFILAAGPTNSPSYFNKKGYNTVIPFNKMVKI